MLVTYRAVPTDRKFGVELEVSNTISKKALGKLVEEYECCCGNHREVRVTTGNKGWAETRRNLYWHVKYDSTCGPKGKYKDSGWEIASFIGQGLKDLRSISHLADYLHDRKVEVNSNCGLHVHVDAENLDLCQMGSLLARWIKIEQILTLICPTHRWSNVYCRSLRTRMLNKGIRYFPSRPDDFWHQIAPQDFNTHSNEEKKYTLNTVGYATGSWNPLYDRQTVELRLPECLLSTEHVLNWVRLILNFVDHAKCLKEPPKNTETITSVAEVLTLLGLAGDNQRFLILDDQLLDTKLWLLNKIVSAQSLPIRFRLEAMALWRFISKI